LEEWDKIISYSKKFFKVCFDVFGENSLNYILRKNIYGIKIHSSDLTNKSILNKLTKFNNKIFISAGGSNLKEIDYAINFLKDKKPILMHGYQNYPTHIDDTGLDKISFYRSIYKNKIEYGLQDHLEGDKQEASIVPLISLAYQPSYIEKHVILKRKKNRVDSYSSLEPKEIKKLDDDIIYYSKSIKFKKKLSIEENKYRKNVKKNWVAKKNINPGEKFSLDNIQMKRVNSKNFNPFFFEELKNQKCIKKITTNELITKSNFENKVVALVIVRSRSSRLPNKALLKINRKTLIEILLSRLKLSKKLDDIIICTTKNKEDNKIVEIAKKNNLKFYRGNTLNVLSRMINSIKKDNKIQLAVRVTGDDIIIDPEYLDKTIDLSIKTNSDYTTNKGIPSGCEVEIFTKKCLMDLNKYAINPNGTEYLTNYITDNPNEFKISHLKIPKQFKKNFRLTIDTRNDFLVVKKILGYFKSLNFSLRELIAYCNKNKMLFKKYKQIKQKKIPHFFSTKMKWGK
jgi:spore coat polysaccharide biosynthesis protein SpsF (cytidylyltransferase family)/sialic acid synthase SpsE